jgi:hypothetical protein
MQNTAFFSTLLEASAGLVAVTPAVGPSASALPVHASEHLRIMPVPEALGVVVH